MSSWPFFMYSFKTLYPCYVDSIKASIKSLHSSNSHAFPVAMIECHIRISRIHELPLTSSRRPSFYKEESAATSEVFISNDPPVVTGVCFSEIIVLSMFNIDRFLVQREGTEQSTKGSPCNVAAALEG